MKYLKTFEGKTKHSMNEPGKGVIQKDGSVKIKGEKELQWLPKRGTDEEGYPEVLIDAKAVGGSGWMSRQSIKPYIGMTVRFVWNYNGTIAYNFEILKKDQKK